MNKHYILSNGRIKTVSLMKWAKWIEIPRNKNIEQTNVERGGRVSTVFLGLDYNFSGHGGAILFETMYFPDYYTKNKARMADGDMDRYASLDDAKAGHWKMVEKYGGRKKIAESSHSG